MKNKSCTEKKILTTWLKFIFSPHTIFLIITHPQRRYTWTFTASKHSILAWHFTQIYCKEEQKNETKHLIKRIRKINPKKFVRKSYNLKIISTKKRRRKTSSQQSSGKKWSKIKMLERNEHSGLNCTSRVETFFNVILKVIVIIIISDFLFEKKKKRNIIFPLKIYQIVW